MGKYFSKDVAAAAYRELASLTDDPTQQGQTQISSGLKYVVALSRFANTVKHDFNTKEKEEKSLFNSYVGEVVALDDAWATRNFFEKFTDAKDFDIGSNLYSSSLMTLSTAEPAIQHPYPRRGSSPLFKVQNGRLLIDTINSKSIAKYLPTNALRASFIVWLCRYYELPDNAAIDSVMPELKKILLEKYSAPLIEGLWDQGEPTLDIISRDFDNVFSNARPVITRKDVDPNAVDEDVFGTINISIPHNYIFFGAPGTGKSYQLNELADNNFAGDNIQRVTFYPDYTYSQFVGSFKPTTRYAEPKDGEPTTKMEPYISYEFIPGPFLETYIKAVQNPAINYLLIVEEINRANPAAVFGDVFQLLDRDKNGRSAYEVSVPREMEDYLRVHLPEYATAAHISSPEKLLNEQKRLGRQAKRLCLPPNMYIWATMNSADQGVFPMDTAFKRRWDFHYIDIDEGADADINGVKLSDIEVPCGKFTVKWNDLRMAINDFLLSDDIHVNEDKLLGPFFISPESLDPKTFAQVFMDKVLLYLYEDAGKTKRTKLFRSDLKTYSQVCEAFREEGAAIFSTGFPKLEYCPESETDTANGPQE